MKKEKKSERGKRAKKTNKNKEKVTRGKSSKAEKGKKAKKSKKAKKIIKSGDFDFGSSKDFDNEKRLTLVERLKLIRNSIVFLIVIAAIFVFLKDSIVTSEEIDLIVIFSSILFTLIAFLLFVYFIKHILDLKNGSVEVVRGTVSKGSDDVLIPSNLPICTIVLDRRVHYIGIHHYFRIKEGDFVVLRRAPITRCIVGVQITHKEK